jgi:hypothetical protein
MSFEDEATTCSPTMYSEGDASFSMYGLIVKIFTSLFGNVGKESSRDVHQTENTKLRQPREKSKRTLLSSCTTRLSLVLHEIKFLVPRGVEILQVTTEIPMSGVSNSIVDNRKIKRTSSNCSNSQL